MRRIRETSVTSSFREHVSRKNKTAEEVILKVERQDGGDGEVWKGASTTTIVLYARNNFPGRVLSWYFQCWPDTVDPRK